MLTSSILDTKSHFCLSFKTASDICILYRRKELSCDLTFKFITYHLNHL